MKHVSLGGRRGFGGGCIHCGHDTPKKNTFCGKGNGRGGWAEGDDAYAIRQVIKSRRLNISTKTGRPRTNGRVERILIGSTRDQIGR